MEIGKDWLDRRIHECAYIDEDGYLENRGETWEFTSHDDDFWHARLRTRYSDLTSWSIGASGGTHALVTTT